MAFFLRLFLLLVIGLGAEGGLSWYFISTTPEPMSYLDIRHQEDYEKLINVLVPTTRAVLERDGEVAQPIAFGIEMGDQVDFLNAEGKSTIESLRLIVRDFKQGAHSGFYRSVGVAYDTTRNFEGRTFDAIEFRFEHIDGEAFRAWFPYYKHGAGNVTYGPIHFERQTPEVFSHHNLEWGEEN